MSKLKQDLDDAIGTNSDHDACQAAIDVMRWGGVVRGNVSWLNANREGLVTLLANTRNSLDSGNLRDKNLFGKALRFNAGMTKVYPLICKQPFIIYDSQVAAALGWAVVKYKQAKGEDIPSELRFPWLPSKDGSNAKTPKQRNPNPGGGKEVFPRLYGASKHAEWNLKASWLLQAVIDHDNATDSVFKKNSPPGGPLLVIA